MFELLTCKRIGSDMGGFTDLKNLPENALS